MTATFGTDLPIRWERSRDDYGRSVHYLHRQHAPTVAGAVVRLPAVWVEQYGKSRAYLANDWTNPDRDDPAKVTYHATLAKAKAHLLSVIR